MLKNATSSIQISLVEKIGIGVDIEVISRFDRLFSEKDLRSLHNIFKESELDFCLSTAYPSQHAAARFCAKEAAIKALSELDIQTYGYLDIVISRDESGKPSLSIPTLADVLTTKVTMAHCDEYAIAMVIIEDNREKSIPEKN